METIEIRVLLYLTVSLFGWNGAISQSAELVATHIIYRHGDRAPAALYPTSTSDPSSWPNGLGQLTVRGQLQHVRLGQYLRRRYSRLLNSTYLASEVTVRSTDYDRTLMSAYSNLLGLYPTSQTALEKMLSTLREDEKWPEMTPWQPIPVHTVPTTTDYLLSNGDCPRFYELLEELQNGEMMKNLTMIHQDFFDQLQLKSGMAIHDIFDAWYIADIVIIESLYNRAPAWVTPAILAQLRNITDLSFTQLFSPPNIGRLLGGPLVRDVMQNVQDTIDKKTSARKAKIYSAHDITIAAVLSFFGLQEIPQPPYASALFFDLYRLADNNYSIRLEYHTSMNHPIKSITLPPCSNVRCSTLALDTWLADKLPGLNMIDECKRHKPAQSRKYHDYKSLIFNR